MTYDVSCSGNIRMLATLGCGADPIVSREAVISLETPTRAVWIRAFKDQTLQFGHILTASPRTRPGQSYSPPR